MDKTNQKKIHAKIHPAHSLAFQTHLTQKPASALESMGKGESLEGREKGGGWGRQGGTAWCSQPGAGIGFSCQASDNHVHSTSQMKYLDQVCELLCATAQNFEICAKVKLKHKKSKRLQAYGSAVLLLLVGNRFRHSMTMN